MLSASFLSALMHIPFVNHLQENIFRKTVKGIKLDINIVIFVTDDQDNTWFETLR